MILDRLLSISGRQNAVNELFRLANKGINVIVTGVKQVGKSFIMYFVFQNFCNIEGVTRKPVYIKAQGTRRDFDQIIIAMSECFADIKDDECKEQSYTEFIKGSQPQLERRILAGVKNSDKPYIFFIEEMKKLTDSMRIFLGELLKTGNASIVAEPYDLSDAKAREFYQGFDVFEAKRLSDERMGDLFDYWTDENEVKFEEGSREEIRKRLIVECAGIPGRLKEKIERGMKERLVRKDEILEQYPSSYRREFSINMIVVFVVVFFMAYRFFLRGLGTVTDMVSGGIIFAIALLLYRISSRFK